MSEGKWNNTMNFNLYKHHISYIQDLSVFASKYNCRYCSRVFTKLANMKKHFGKCGKVIRYRYPGNYYSKYVYIFEKLETFNVFVPKTERTYQWITVFDYEAMLYYNHSI